MGTVFVPASGLDMLEKLMVMTQMWEVRGRLRAMPSASQRTPEPGLIGRFPFQILPRNQPLMDHGQKWRGRRLPYRLRNCQEHIHGKRVNGSK